VAHVWPPDSNWQPLPVGPVSPTMPRLDAGDVIMKSPCPVARDKNDELERARCFLSTPCFYDDLDEHDLQHRRRQRPRHHDRRVRRRGYRQQDQVRRLPSHDCLY
jgi:hypothetical protein